MKFALVAGERQEAQPGLTGTCPGCGSAVLAKCGRHRVWHWSHKGRLNCDPWWEPETEWHRRWKNLFPVSWQEVALRAKDTGELHIADVRTPHGLVMEFQHSAIKPDEQDSREQFYRNMIWVVDCTRLKTDRPRIDQNMPYWTRLTETHVRKHGNPKSIFPRAWLNRTVPVIFDFDGTDGNRNNLICLLPNRYMRSDALFFPLSQTSLVMLGNNEATIFDWREIHAKLAEEELRQLNYAQKRLRRYGFR